MGPAALWRQTEEAMKHIRAQSGPFAERPHFKLGEIERTCADELEKMALYPAEPGPVRIDRFIEKRFGVAHDYDDLPPGVLGYTKFGGKGVERIIIARALAEESSVAGRRRERSTMAHEAGHGLLHAYLFALGVPAPSLFESQDCQGTQILCRDVVGLGNRPAKQSWSEFQANRAISGLLLPRKLVMKALAPYMEPRGDLGGSTLCPGRRRQAESFLAETFDVNSVVARIYLSELFPPESEGQLLL